MLTQSDNNSLAHLENKVGQMFFIGLPSETFDIETQELLDEIKPGGVCLFARNTKDAQKTRTLLDSVRDSSKAEPFLSVDQEGGLVDRLRRISEPLPAATDISRSGNLDNASRLAKITAELVRILGFNMNFAPVVDVVTDDRAGCVMLSQKRVFGNSVSDVIDYAGSYLSSLQSGGVMGCLKHFPGIGAVSEDPHDGLPAIKCSYDEIDSIDLVPYKDMFSKGIVDAVMIGHAVFPMLDLQEEDTGGKLLPSSLSQSIVIELLRNRLNFDGLALTDDLEMGAIVNSYGVGEASVMSVEAGNDFVLICNDSKAMQAGFRAVCEAVKSGRISEKRIDVSLKRIATARSKLHSPLEFDEMRIKELSLETIELKKTLL